MRIASFFLLLSFFLLSGCETAQDNSASPASAAVSSIPWNKPASWEGLGALGGFSPQGGH
jgi:hypothetical protein